MADTGLGDKNKCREASAVSPPLGEGSSAPRRRRGAVPVVRPSVTSGAELVHDVVRIWSTPATQL